MYKLSNMTAHFFLTERRQKRLCKGSEPWKLNRKADSEKSKSKNKNAQILVFLVNESQMSEQLIFKLKT